MEFRDNRDAEDAMYALDRSTIGGREISVSIMLGIPTAVRPPPQSLVTANAVVHRWSCQRRHGRPPVKC